MFYELLSFVSVLVSITSTDAQTKILITNDDGWAAANIRAQYTALTDAGYNIVLSAPALNGSGTGSLDLPPTPVLLGCEFDSCPPLSPATDHNASDARLNYVNSFPVTSVKYGITTAAPPFFGGSRPDFVFSGPNVGGNTGLNVFVSGTVGAATEAAKEGIPSVAVSGAFDTQVSYTTLSTPSDSTTAATVYAALGVRLTQALLAPSPGGSSPILPKGITLNVNYPDTTGPCVTADAFKFVLTRIFDATVLTGKDVSTCGSTRLPTEGKVVGTAGCFASVSVMDALTKLDVDSTAQAFVLKRLGNLLSCLQ